ncbi:MAG: tripartite tricarboxylate transporter substrate binding protein [Alphaproteobacteria bacterium]
MRRTDDKAAVTLSRRKATGLMAGALAGLTISPSRAQSTYPNRPVRCIVTFAPGGTVDVFARLAAQYLSQRFGQQFFVENAAGATGNRGTTLAARSAPDGYTLLFALSTHAVNPALFNNLQYDAMADFQPITLAVASTHVLTVHPSVPAKDARELVQWLKQPTTKASYAHGGAGTQGHLLGERFRLSQNLDVTPVPFTGAGPAIASVVGGHTPIGWSTMASAAQMISGGQLRALAVTSKARSRQLPDTPTMIEQGFPEIEGDTWVGVMAPARTPMDIVELLNREISTYIQQPETRERLAQLGFEVVGLGPAEFTRSLAQELVYWKRVVETTGVKLDQ